MTRRHPDDFDEPEFDATRLREDRSSTDERGAAMAERARAEAHYDARQMRYGENVPSAQELAGER